MSIILFIIMGFCGWAAFMSFIRGRFLVAIMWFILAVFMGMFAQNMNAFENEYSQCSERGGVMVEDSCVVY